MAQILSASIYGQGAYTQGTAQDLTKGFSTNDLFIEDIANDPISFNGVSCISKITQMPTGLVVKTFPYYSATVAVTLITAANA